MVVVLYKLHDTAIRTLQHYTYHSSFHNGGMNYNDLEPSLTIALVMPVQDIWMCPVNFGADWILVVHMVVQI